MNAWQAKRKRQNVPLYLKTDEWKHIPSFDALNIEIVGNASGYSFRRSSSSSIICGVSLYFLVFSDVPETKLIKKHWLLRSRKYFLEKMLCDCIILPNWISNWNSVNMDGCLFELFEFYWNAIDEMTDANETHEINWNAQSKLQLNKILKIVPNFFYSISDFDQQQTMRPFEKF